MRKLVVENKVTLDGVFDKQAEWQMQFWEDPDEMVRYSKAHITAFDAMLLGRVTYQGLVAVWPSMTDGVGYADWINSIPKYCSIENAVRRWVHSVLEMRLMFSTANISTVSRNSRYHRLRSHSWAERALDRQVQNPGRKSPTAPCPRSKARAADWSACEGSQGLGTPTRLLSDDSTEYLSDERNSYDHVH